MKKIIIVGILCLVCLISSITEFATHINATNVESPYYTYTADSYGNLIKTSDAYLPGEQLNLVNDEKFVSLEHIYIDENDYLYITDSKIKTYVEQYDSLTGEVIINEQTGNPKTKIYTGKIIVLDGNLNLIGEIYDENINFPKSTFVTEDKIYIVDFTSSNILIYDKL